MSNFTPSDVEVVANIQPQITKWRITISFSVKKGNKRIIKNYDMHIQLTYKYKKPYIICMLS